MLGTCGIRAGVRCTHWRARGISYRKCSGRYTLVFIPCRHYFFFGWSGPLWFCWLQVGISNSHQLILLSSSSSSRYHRYFPSIPTTFFFLFLFLFSFCFSFSFLTICKHIHAPILTLALSALQWNFDIEQDWKRITGHKVIMYPLLV